MKKVQKFILCQNGILTNNHFSGCLIRYIIKQRIKIKVKTLKLNANYYTLLYYVSCLIRQRSILDYFLEDCNLQSLRPDEK